MYYLLNSILPSQVILALGSLVTFGLTFLLLKHPLSFLPKDQGRKFAVNGELSKGKTRGVGLVMVLGFLIGMVLFLPLDAEYVIYGLLLICIMLSGYLDDASEKPWNEYKKGLIDLVISAVAVITYLNFNSSTIGFLAWELELPKWLFAILGIVLFWASINVTNCSDGVDGLCASLCTVSVLAFTLLFKETLGSYVGANMLFIAVLLAYLYFNCSPSAMLMGDAGSRALGFYLALIALRSQHPVIFLLLAAVMIVDGGSGLVKISLKRFLKISVLVNTKTPIHDHMRKNKGWSDTQVVIRFVIFQAALAVLAACLIL